MALPVSRDFVRRLRAPAYAFLFVTLFFQITDFFLGLIPYHIDAVVWRFGALGSGANSIGNVLLLILLIYTLALAAGDRGYFVFVGTMAAMVAIFLFTGAGSFALDAIQLRGKVETTAVPRFDLASGQALSKMIIEGFVAVLFAVSAFRSWNAANREVSREERAESPIIGGSRPALRAP